MSFFKLRSLLIAGTMMLATPVLVACAPDGADSESESVGTLTAALTSIGSDGAVYQMPAGAAMSLNGVDVSYSNYFNLEGPDANMDIQLPVGNYEAWVYVNHLERVDGSTTTPVKATLQNTQPVTVSILEGQSTNLVLNFGVQGLDTLVFGSGDLNVSVAVEDLGPTTRPGGAFMATTMTYDGVQYGPDSTPEQQALFPAVVGATENLNFTFNSTADWQLAGTSVCIPIAPYSAGYDGDTTANLVSLMFGGAGSLCINDAGVAGQPDGFSFNVNASVVPPEMETVLPANTQTWFYFTGDLGLDVFDGFTLNQTALLEDISTSTAYVYVGIYDGDSGTSVVDISASGANNVFRLNP